MSEELEKSKLDSVYFSFECTDELKNLVADALSSGRLGPRDPIVLKESLKTGIVGSSAISALHAYLSNSKWLPDTSVFSVLKKAGGVLHSPYQAANDVNSAEFNRREAIREKWREEMRSRQAHREYSNLVNSVRMREEFQVKLDSFSNYRQQLYVGLNVLFSLVSAAGVGFYLGGGSLFGHVDHSKGSRPWILAIVFAVVLLLVEVSIVILRLGRVDAQAKMSSLASQDESLQTAKQAPSVESEVHPELSLAVKKSQ
jgi:F0F1-type ATP synthase assembly protein I